MLQELKKVNEKFDLVIAHNPGSFYPALAFAQKNKIPFGIDLEDYHPGETNDKKAIQQSKNLNKAVLPKANYITVASPLILEYSESDLEKSLINKHVIFNYFPSAQFIIPQTQNSEKLKLVWFSQNISYNRGLEQLIPAIKENDKIELHLFGNCDESFRKEWLSGLPGIEFHGPLPQSELHGQLSRFDIGLAVEPAKDLNNELAVSNKILAYFQSGLYILASDTRAQQRFINEHPEHGMITSLDFENLHQSIQKLVDQKQFLRECSEERFKNARSYNWENESKKLLKIWEVSI